LEVSAQGEKMVVESNQWTQVALNQPPSPLRLLPDPVGINSPADASIYYDRGRPPKIPFAWQRQSDATNYRFVLARDPIFSDIVTEKRLSKTNFTHGGLTKGTYFWRVSALQNGSEGSFSEVRRFRIIMDHAPPKPSVLFPPENVYYSKFPPKIKFAWDGQPGAKGYHFVLARDATFSDIVTDKRFSKTRFTHGGLANGTYFWRVSALQDNAEGSFSKARRFRVVQDQEPPLLQVQFPPETIETSEYTLYGKTEPGANVYVGGNRVTISNTGEFQYHLRLRRGVNVIPVAAVDEANNVSSCSQIVRYKYE
jgi:hypothetical protein